MRRLDAALGGAARRAAKPTRKEKDAKSQTYLRNGGCPSPVKPEETKAASSRRTPKPRQPHSVAYLVDVFFLVA
ncbi:hypothetical protein FJY63_15435 [Candidatus Sumerlaeota bacterium]|nr:hypothetical protein [Candidatus Sumerlaeota bacterium]